MYHPETCRPPACLKSSCGFQVKRMRAAGVYLLSHPELKEDFSASASSFFGIAPDWLSGNVRIYLCRRDCERRGTSHERALFLLDNEPTPPPPSLIVQCSYSPVLLFNKHFVEFATIMDSFPHSVVPRVFKQMRKHLKSWKVLLQFVALETQGNFTLCNRNSVFSLSALIKSRTAQKYVPFWTEEQPSRERFFRGHLWRVSQIRRRNKSNRRRVNGRKIR